MTPVAPDRGLSAQFVRKRGTGWSYRHAGTCSVLTGACVAAGIFGVKAGIGHDPVGGALCAAVSGPIWAAVNYLTLRRRRTHWRRAGLSEPVR
jgi:hypothetical protein